MTTFQIICFNLFPFICLFQLCVCFFMDLLILLVTGTGCNCLLLFLLVPFMHLFVVLVCRLLYLFTYFTFFGLLGSLFVAFSETNNDKFYISYVLVPSKHKWFIVMSSFVEMSMWSTSKQVHTWQTCSTKVGSLALRLCFQSSRFQIMKTFKIIFVFSNLTFVCLCTKSDKWMRTYFSVHVQFGAAKIS